jgi:CRP-like cAMP-binding protein
MALGEAFDQRQDGAMAAASPLDLILSGTWFAAELPRAARSRLAALASLVEIPARATVIEEGAPCRELGVVIDGRLALMMRPPGGRARTILTIDRGDVFCWSALLNPSTATSTVVTTEATRAIVFEGQRLRSSLKSDPELGALVYERLLAALGRRLVATRLQLLDLYGRFPVMD